MYIFIYIHIIFIQCKNYYGYILKYHTEENMPMVRKMYMNSHLCILISSDIYIYVEILDFTVI